MVAFAVPLLTVGSLNCSREAGVPGTEGTSEPGTSDEMGGTESGTTETETSDSGVADTAGEGSTGSETSDTGSEPCGAEPECPEDTVCVDATCVDAWGGVRYRVSLDVLPWGCPGSEPMYQLRYSDTYGPGQNFTSGPRTCPTLFDEDSFELKVGPLDDPVLPGCGSLAVDYNDASGKPFISTFLYDWPEFQPELACGFPPKEWLHDGTATVDFNFSEWQGTFRFEVLGR